MIFVSSAPPPEPEPPPKSGSLNILVILTSPDDFVVSVKGKDLSSRAVPMTLGPPADSPKLKGSLFFIFSSIICFLVLPEYFPADAVFSLPASKKSDFFSNAILLFILQYDRFVKR